MDRFASEVIELSTRHNFGYWLATGAIYRGWARSASGKTAEGIPWIVLADRTSEALEAINEAEPMAERFEQRYFRAELHGLRAVFLAAIGADEPLIEASFCTAIRTAKEQKSISLEKRAQVTYTEYHRQKASGSGGRGFRLPLW